MSETPELIRQQEFGTKHWGERLRGYALFELIDKNDGLKRAFKVMDFLWERFEDEEDDAVKVRLGEKLLKQFHAFMKLVPSHVDPTPPKVEEKTGKDAHAEAIKIMQEVAELAAEREEIERQNAATSDRGLHQLSDRVAEQQRARGSSGGGQEARGLEALDAARQGSDESLEPAPDAVHQQPAEPVDVERSEQGGEDDSTPLPDLHPRDGSLS